MDRISSVWPPVLMADQDCGIRYEGASPAGGQHAQQPEPHGQIGIRARGTFASLLIHRDPPDSS